MTSPEPNNHTDSPSEDHTSNTTTQNSNASDTSAHDTSNAAYGDQADTSAPLTGQTNETNADSISQSDLLSDQQLKDTYGDKFEFYEAGEKNPHALKQFLYYTIKRFELGKRRQYFNTRDEIFDTIMGKVSDYEVYTEMRKLQQENLKLVEEEKEKRLRSVEKEKYKGTIDGKVRKLRDTLRSHYIPIGRNGDIHQVLDIGTEKLQFLDSLYYGLYLPSIKGCAVGINIDDGFCHYDPELFQRNTKDSRFQLYNGKEIPFEDKKFDLITIYSVIHHIPCEDFKVVAKDIARVCGKYLFIKDVDMSDRVENIFFRLQHYLYEGILTPGKTSYLNDSVTLEKTINVLEEEGFETLEKKKVGNFNGTYYAILKKKDFNPKKRIRSDSHPRRPPPAHRVRQPHPYAPYEPPPAYAYPYDNYRPPQGPPPSYGPPGQYRGPPPRYRGRGHRGRGRGRGRGYYR